MKTIFNHLIDLIVPNSCFSCSSKISQNGGLLCEECSTGLEKYTLSDRFFEAKKRGIRVSTGKPAQHVLQNLLIDSCYSVFNYKDQIRDLIHYMKYREYTRISGFFADSLIHFLEKDRPYQRIDWVFPVPLHQVRKRDRGFNQSELIAAKISKHFSWNYATDVVRRNRNTKSQYSLDSMRRHNNVQRAFSVDKNSNLADLDVLIVDDILTTGATVNAITEVLKNKGASRVHVLTVARA